MDGEVEALLYAVVWFDGGGRCAVRQVVIPFEDARAADGHARAAGYPDYLVAPLGFAVAAAPPPPRPRDRTGDPCPARSRPTPKGRSMTTATAAPASALRLELAHATTVEVDGTTVPDPDPCAGDGPARLPAVTVRLPGYLAHTLSHLLADWNRICAVTEAANPAGWDWTAQSCALHRAAQAAGTPEAAGCTLDHHGLPTRPR